MHAPNFKALGRSEFSSPKPPPDPHLLSGVREEAPWHGGPVGHPNHQQATTYGRVPATPYAAHDSRSLPADSRPTLQERNHQKTWFYRQKMYLHRQKSPIEKRTTRNSIFLSGRKLQLASRNVNCDVDPSGKTVDQARRALLPGRRNVRSHSGMHGLPRCKSAAGPSQRPCMQTRRSSKRRIVGGEAERRLHAHNIIGEVAGRSSRRLYGIDVAAEAQVALHGYPDGPWSSNACVLCSCDKEGVINIAHLIFKYANWLSATRILYTVGRLALCDSFL